MAREVILQSFLALGGSQAHPLPIGWAKSTANPLSGILGLQSEIQATTLPWPVELAGHSFPSTGPGSWLVAPRSPEGSDGTWLSPETWRGLRQGKPVPTEAPTRGGGPCTLLAARPALTLASSWPGRQDSQLLLVVSEAHSPAGNSKKKRSAHASEEGRGGPGAGGVSQSGVLPLAVPPAGLSRPGLKKSILKTEPAATLPGLRFPRPPRRAGRAMHSGNCSTAERS